MDTQEKQEQGEQAPGVDIDIDQSGGGGEQPSEQQGGADEQGGDADE